MTPTFDLLEEPWIPVVDHAGQVRDVGIRDALLRSHEWVEVRDLNPLCEFGVYRLLTALVQDILQLTAEEDLRDLLEARGDGPPAEVLNRWLEVHGHRFRLFDPVYPFLQDSSLKDAEKKSVALLQPAIPTGTNANHFFHGSEAAFAVCPAVAARLLTTAAAFMTMGGAGLSPSINGAPPWYVVVRGESLWETLLLNCCTRDLPHARTLGVPPWRRTENPVGKQKGAGLLEALTWQPRRILLFPGGAGRCSMSGQASPQLVRQMAFVAGASVDFNWEDDPNVAYRLAKEGPLPLRPREGREVWRDVGAFTFAADGDAGEGGYRRPKLIDQLAALLGNYYRAGNVPLRLQVYGLRTDLKTKVFEWQRESLAPPACLTVDLTLQMQARDALDEAEGVGRLLRMAIRRAYPREGKGNKAGAFDTLIGAAQSHFWHSLRIPYWELLEGLAAQPGDAPEAALVELRARWGARVLDVGKRAMEEATEDLDADRRALERLTQARQYFANATYRVFHPAPRKKKP